MAVQAVTADNVFEFRGLSTDDKPGKDDGLYNGIKLGTGTVFFEIDTGDVYFFNADGTTPETRWLII